MTSFDLTADRAQAKALREALARLDAQRRELDRISKRSANHVEDNAIEAWILEQRRRLAEDKRTLLLAACGDAER